MIGSNNFVVYNNLSEEISPTIQNELESNCVEISTKSVIAVNERWNQLKMTKVASSISEWKVKDLRIGVFLFMQMKAKTKRF